MLTKHSSTGKSRCEIEQQELLLNKAIEDIQKTSPDYVPPSQGEINLAAKQIATQLAIFGSSGRFGLSSLYRLARTTVTGHISGQRVRDIWWYWRYAIVHILWIWPVSLIGCMLMLFGVLYLAITGNDARITDTGIEVFSRLKGRIAFHAWADIKEVRDKFDPPFFCWELVLRNEQTTLLPAAQLDIKKLLDHGVTVKQTYKRKHNSKISAP